jgi:hypothetical protein
MWNIKKKNNRQESAIKTLILKDVIFAPQKSTVSFKEKHWRIEINSKDLKNFFRKNKKRIVFALVIFIFIWGIFGYLFVSRADVAYFYPSACLGGWKNPQNAQGKPDLGGNAAPEEFDENNSAVLRNVISQFFCGNLEGETPQDSLPKKAVLKFSWVVKTDLENESPTNIEEQSTSTLIQVIEATTTNIQDNSNNVNTENTPDNNNSSTPTFFWQAVKNFASQGINLALAETEEIISENQEQPSGVATEQATSSTEQATSSTEQATPATTSEQATSSAQTTSSESIISSSTIYSEPTVSPVSPIDEPFLEILYSLDGSNWQSLGKVSTKNWQNLELEIPNFEWEDLPNLQISIQSLSPVEFVPTVYLDGIILNVEYEKQTTAEQITEENQPQEEQQIEQPEEQQDKQQEIIPEELKLNIKPAKQFFFNDENAEFILSQTENNNFWQRIRNFFGNANNRLAINEAILINPENKEIPADFQIQEENNAYRLIINKPNDWQAGNWQLKIKAQRSDKIYGAEIAFEWKKRPEKKVVFKLSEPAVASERYLEWHPEFKKIKNNKKNIGGNFSLTADGTKLIFKGTCQQEYFVILGYRHLNDYKTNPTSFIYNKAFNCKNGSYYYELNDLPLNINPQTYYFFVAEQNSNGSWYPISGIKPVEISIEER